MSFKKNLFFCLDCDNVFLSSEAAVHPCHTPLRIIQATVTFDLKRTRWGRFVHRLWSLDITYWLAFMSAVIINSMLITHVNLSFKQVLLESFCMGFLIPRLLNNDPK